MANIEGDRRRAPWGRLETEFAELRAKLVEQAAVIDKLIAENAGLTVEVARLKAQLGMNSKNSSRPPSSDGYAKPAPKSRRGRSGNRPHEQPGAPVGNLVAVGEPDVVVVHAPGRCGGCAAGLADASVVGEVTRQVFDLPPVKAVITEHRAQRRRCGCGTDATASFPAEATGATCYGPNLRALICYLVVRQHIPIKRVAELMRDAYAIPVSTGTIVAMVQQGAGMLAEFLASLRDTLAGADVVYAICDAHHLRELDAAGETEGQQWALDMIEPRSEFFTCGAQLRRSRQRSACPPGHPPGQPTERLRRRRHEPPPRSVHHLPVASRARR